METAIQDDLVPIVKALADLHNGISRAWAASGHEPMEGSQAALELSQYEQPGRLRDVHYQADLLIQGAADHFVAFIKSMTGLVTTIAPWTCVRAVIESGARAAWLLDPTLNAHSRVERSLAFRLAGLREQVLFLRAAGAHSQAAAVKRRAEEVERDSESSGYENVARKLPAATDIIKVALAQESGGPRLSAEATYRLLSAMAHGHTWAYQELGFTAVGGQPNLRTQHISPQSIGFLCSRAANALGTPVLLKWQLFGWDKEAMDRLVRSTLARLGSYLLEQ